MIWRGFGSDNHSGVHPEVFAAMMAANMGHAHAYGDDEWTEQAVATLRRHVGEDTDIAFVWNGTGANCVSLATLCRPWEGVVCASDAHINTDECAAPERTAGVKLVPVDTPDGKLTPELVKPSLTGFDFEHSVQPKVISISNVTEYGTVYSAAEIARLADLAHAHGMLLHLDGARIANACASLDATLAELTVDAGVDALSLGGTKNGMMAGEAVVLFGAARSPHLKYVRKQLTQLSSKMRFISAQFEAMYAGSLWIESARHANAMARRLADGARSKGVELTQVPQANEIFALLSAETDEAIRSRFHYYAWRESVRPGVHEVRWVTSWDTTEGDVDALIDAL